MTRKNWFLIFAVILLGTLYVIYFTDWFRPKTVRIFHTYRNSVLRFGAPRPLRFTELKVVPLAEGQMNAEALPLWHLVSDSNSVPVEQFVYGQPIRGMRPVIKGIRPQPLATNVTYRLLVTAGKITGQNDFVIK